MGEYAIRNSDGREIKIGTCESMYYLRFEDRDKVSGIPGHERGNVRPWIDEEAAQIRFRLPFPDEDNVLPGEYGHHDRGERLWKKTGEGRFETYDDFEDASTADDPGTIQLTHKCGLLLNVPCYHGQKLPESSNDIKGALERENVVLGALPVEARSRKRSASHLSGRTLSLLPARMAVSVVRRDRLSARRNEGQTRGLRQGRNGKGTRGTQEGLNLAACPQQDAGRSVAITGGLGRATPRSKKEGELCGYV